VNHQRALQIFQKKLGIEPGPPRPGNSSKIDR